MLRPGQGPREVGGRRGEGGRAGAGCTRTQLEGVSEIHLVVGDVGKVDQVVKGLEASLFALLVSLQQLGKGARVTAKTA